MKFLGICGALGLALLVMLSSGVPAAAVPRPLIESPEAREVALQRALVIAEGVDLPRAGIQPTPLWLAEQLGVAPHPGLALGEPVIRADSLPEEADILDHLPPAGMQQYNDCAAFAVGYYGISYWNFRELGEAGSTNPSKVGSPAYIYNQISGGVDGGSLYLVYPLMITCYSGCAFQSDFSPGNCVSLPNLAVQEKALLQRTRDTTWFFLDANSPEPGDNPVGPEAIAIMKQTLAGGTPVMVGIYDYASFEGQIEVPSGRVYYGPLAVGDEFRGFHAMILAGYEDNAALPGGGCFLVRNSWGSDWGFDGDIWVTYAFIRNYAIEAYDFNDFEDYVPTTYVVLEADHPWRGDLDVTVNVDDDPVAWYSPWLFYYNDQRDDVELVVDITGYVKSTTEKITLVIRDRLEDLVGSVDEAFLVDDGEFTDFHFAQGTDIPDEGTVTGVITLEGAGGAGTGGGGGCALSASAVVCSILVLPLFLLFRGF